LIVIIDDVFLKVFFANAISIEELQGESKKLLKGNSKMCADILESIHLDYRALGMGELMRDTMDPSSNYLSSRQVLKEDSWKKKNDTRIR